MKLFAALAVSSVAAEWEKPSYWDIFQAHHGRKTNFSWGFPVGTRAAAHWSNCPQLETPENASGVACDQATCTVICNPGYQSTAQRRTRCRHNKVNGFFWKRQLSGCQSCDPAEPTVADPNVTFSCAVNMTKNRKICVGTCPSGANFPGGKGRMKAKCKCPKNKETGMRQCGWMFKKTTATSFDQVVCENVPVETTTTAGGDATTTTTSGGGGDATTTTTTSGGGGNPATTTTTSGGGGDPATTTTTTTTPAATTTDSDAFTVAKCEAALAGNVNANEICTTIEFQNTFRVLHQVAPFGIPSTTLCDNAQAWAQNNADNNQMAHSSNSGEGENLAMGTTMGMQLATQLWQDEDQFWNFNTAGECTGIDNESQCPKCSGGPNNSPLDCLHFTQNIWKTTTSVCYGKAVGSDGNTYVAARYSPPGNFLGIFDQNVLPRA